MEKKYNNIIFFDGVCNVCDKTVDFILTHDKKLFFLFSSLQSSFAKEFYNDRNRDISMETIEVFNEGKFLTRSEAIKFILKNLSGYPKFFGFLLGFFPTLFSDYFYRLFAKYRYKVFGKNDVCKVPNKDFLDRFYE
jgi:predicted DCC family thiol-disulfide oxidoreductase YuxK